LAATLEALQRRMHAMAHMAPAPGAVELIVARRRCGQVAPAAAETLAGAVPGFALIDGRLEMDDTGLDFAGRCEALQRAARALLRAGITAVWRDENLELRPEPDAPALAWIDRSAVRALGITSYSVHLNGFTDDGRVVVAKRAAHKRADPGLWDNLAGGMIIDVATLAVTEGPRLDILRPVAEGTLAEIVQVFDVQLPGQIRLENRDGEVERFETRTVAEVLSAIERGEFTVEAALATLDALRRRGVS
jgi:hypothetical protein